MSAPQQSPKTASKSKGSQTSTNQRSLARWWRQLIFIPLLHNRWMDEQVRQNLTKKVTEAELGHRGEVFLIIENHLPISTAYFVTCHERAIELFSRCRVWDTEENTGVLVYINVCEHELHIVADRGINAHVEQHLWQSLCDEALAGIKQGEVESSLATLLQKIGDLLRMHYHLEHDPEGNELFDAVMYLR